MKPNGWGFVNLCSIMVGGVPWVSTQVNRRSNSLSCKVHKQNCMVSSNSEVSKTYVFTFSVVLEILWCLNSDIPIVAKKSDSLDSSQIQIIDPCIQIFLIS